MTLGGPYSYLDVGSGASASKTRDMSGEDGLSPISVHLQRKRILRQDDSKPGMSRTASTYSLRATNARGLGQGPLAKTPLSNAEAEQN